MLGISIGFNINDRPGAVCALIEQLNPLLESLKSRDGRKWRLDLSKCRYLGPDAASIVGAAMVLSNKHQQLLEVVLPEQPSELSAFCYFSGLRHLIYGEAAPDMSHPDCVTVPLREFHDARHSDVEPVFRLIRAHAELSEDVQIALGVAFSEVIQNVEDHADSPIGAISSARYLTGSGEVRIAIVDLGQGIETTLRKANPDIHDARQALARVLEGGYSAKSRRNNFGQGINNLRIAITGCGGELFIVSGDASVFVRDGRSQRFRMLRSYFPGTGVFFTLPTHPKNML